MTAARSTPPRALGGVVWLVFALAVGACAAESTDAAPASVTAEPTEAVRPAVPEGWRTLTSEVGDVRLAVPPDFWGEGANSTIMAAVPAGPQGLVPFSVMALAPADVGPQPHGEPLLTWLDDVWLPQRLVNVVHREDRAVHLPAGRGVAVTLTTRWDDGGSDRSIVYAIETPDGIAILVFGGVPAERLEQRAEDVEMIALLADFGRDLGE